MTTPIIEGLAALNLLFLAVAVKTPNLQSHILFKMPAAVLGTVLGALAFGRVMGWPA